MTTDEELMQVCSRRVAALKRSIEGEGVQDVLQLNESAEFLDKDDHAELKKVSERSRTRSEQLAEFATAVREHRSRSSGGGGGPARDQRAATRTGAFRSRHCQR